MQQDGPRGIVLASDDTFQEDNPGVEEGPCMDRVDVVAAEDSQACPAAFDRVALLPFLASAFDHAIDTFVSVAPFASASLFPRLASAAWPTGVDTASTPASFYALSPVFGPFESDVGVRLPQPRDESVHYVLRATHPVQLEHL